MRRQVRPQELRRVSKGRRLVKDPFPGSCAGPRLLSAYAGLAQRGAHLFGDLLKGQAPRQWEHYPQDDALDTAGGYQWFYHSHSPEDRADAVEHGHVHLFARRPLWSRRLRSRAEREFSQLCGLPQATAGSRHLLAISFDAKGVPISLFTVNSWVTGDLMLSAGLTLELLASMRLDTGYPEIDTVIDSTVHLCLPEISELMRARDLALVAHTSPNRLEDPSLELLSQIRIDLDTKL
ncbi:MAG: hypothetical protein KGL68_01000 [Burkholderiales bacterium]|nr:hypothetical protein [Burkholderiales bacterium]